MIVTGILSVGVQFLLGRVAFENARSLFLSYAAAELLVFVLPGALYAKIRKKGYASELHLVSFGISNLPLVVLMFFVMALGAVLINMIGSGAGFGEELAFDASRLTGGDYFSDAHTVLYVGLTLGVLPAFCEEFFFRGILLTEYRRYGILPSIFVTSLYFAALHLDFKLFPYYFVSGVALGFTAYTARSALSSAILHALYNVFSLFALPLVLNFISAEAGVIVFYLVGVAFLLFLMLSLGEAERLFDGYSTSGLPSDAPVKRRENFFPAFLEIFSPTFLLAAVLFVLIAFRLIDIPTASAAL